MKSLVTKKIYSVLCLSIIFMFSSGSLVHADDESDAIERCQNALKKWTGKDAPTEIPTFKKGGWLSWDKVWWDNIICESKGMLGQNMVKNLEVNDEYVIFDFYAGKKGEKIYNDIKNDIERSIAILEDRIEILENTEDFADKELKKPNPNYESIRSNVDNIIQKQTGNN